MLSQKFQFKLANCSVPILACILVSGCWVINLHGQSRSSDTAPAIPIELARIYFEQAKSLATADAGRLWGRSLHGPMIFVDSASRFAVANQADNENRHRQVGELWCGSLPADVQIANTSLEWAGVRWTMVMWDAIPQDRFSRGRLLMHESLHRIQPELKHEAASPVNSHLDSMNGRIWLRLEMRALAAALVSDTQDRLDHLRAAMLFRAVRQAECGGNAGTEEDLLEANEGICEYTGFRLCGLPDSVLADRVAVELESKESSPTLSRSFAYTTGPALGLLLDQFDPKWRDTFSQEPKMAAKLARSAGLTFEEALRETALPIAKNYGWDEINFIESERESKRKARLSELLARFEEGRVLEIETGPEFYFSFDPNQAETIDEQRVVHKPLVASDVWGKVEAPEGGLIDFRSPMKLILSVPADVTPDTAPWKLELSSKYQLDTSDSKIWRLKLKK